MTETVCVCERARMDIDSRGSGQILLLSATELDTLIILAEGYKASQPVRVPKLDQKYAG